MRCIPIIATVVVLAGCQSVSNVTPAGSGTYMVGSTVRGGADWTEVKGLTLTKAGEYCSAQGKDFEVIDTKTRGARGWTPQEAELTFRCIDKKTT